MVRLAKISRSVDGPKRITAGHEAAIALTTTKTMHKSASQIGDFGML
jgi:hypothetical protein